MTNRLFRQTVPLARLLVGVAAGYVLLQIDHVTMDAVVAAAFIPMFIGKFTQHLEY